MVFKEILAVATKKNRAVVGILFLVFLFFIMLMIFAVYTIDIVGQQSGQRGASARGQIGVIEIEGVIMESKPIIELLHKAEKDDSVKAILVRINSPGGAVGPTQEIYEEIRRIDSGWSENGLENDEQDDPYTTSKPVFASFGSIAASGGYYVGSAARKIYATPGTLTGSIGVIMQFLDLSELFHMAKIEHNNIQSGRYKDTGSPARPMTEEEEGLLSSVVEGVHEQFVADILATREGRLKKDIRELAQGQIFSGADALDYGLVDELSGLWASGRTIHSELELDGEFSLKFIEKKRRASIFELLDTIDGVVSLVRTKLQSTRVPALMFTP